MYVLIEKRTASHRIAHREGKSGRVGTSYRSGAGDERSFCAGIVNSKYRANTYVPSSSPGIGLVGVRAARQSERTERQRGVICTQSRIGDSDSLVHSITLGVLCALFCTNL